MRKARGFDRAQRMADLIQKTLAQMLLEDMSDERFRMVTVMGVTLSKDFSYAKVFVSVLTDDEEKILATVKALNGAARSLRYHLAQEINIRVTPELKFVYDESTARGFRISSLIDAAINKEKK
jgi:ribosome-binding factor A